MLVLVLPVLNKLIRRLDKRAAAKEATQPAFQRKKRIVASPSKLQPPLTAPSWAICSATGGADTSDSHLVVQVSAPQKCVSDFELTKDSDEVDSITSCEYS